MGEWDTDFPAPDVVDEFGAAVLGDHSLPALQGSVVLGIQPLPGLGHQVADLRPGLCGALEPIEGIGGLCLLASPSVVVPDRLHHFCQVPGPLGRDHVLFRGVGEGQIETRLQCEAVLPHGGDECPVEAVGPGIVEVGGDGEEDREPLDIGPEGEAVPLVLLADVAQRIGGALLVRLVDRHQVGEVEHVDLLQLGGGAVLRSHHVHREIGEVDDLGVGLADARGLQENDVESGCFHHVDGTVDVRGESEVGLAGGQRSHVGAGMRKGVHPDPVAEQSPAGTSSWWGRPR